MTQKKSRVPATLEVGKVVSFMTVNNVLFDATVVQIATDILIVTPENDYYLASSEQKRIKILTKGVPTMVTTSSLVFAYQDPDNNQEEEEVEDDVIES